MEYTIEDGIKRLWKICINLKKKQEIDNVKLIKKT